MGLLKTRPTIRVRVPNEIRPGETFLATVLLDCRREVEVDFVDVTIEGTEAWSVGSGEHRVSRRRTLLRLAARVSEARTLPEGRTAQSVRIPLPREAPPSYRGTSARVDYELRVHASVPWWPDRRAAFEIKVVPWPQPSPETETKIYSSDPDGPRGEEPHVELSLASQWTRVGDVVSGALALSNVGSNRYSEVRVGLRGIETLYDAADQPRTTREAMRYQVRLGAEEAGEGEMIPFRFRLPDDAASDLPASPRPDGARGLFALRWDFELVVGIRWASDLTIQVPFAVLPRSERPGDAPARLAPPTVGSDRLRELWTAVGHPHGLTYDAQALFGRVGETEVVIRRDHMGRGGIFVIAELRYPELHLDLEVEPATAVQKMVGGGARVGDPSWDRDHYVIARDEQQVANVLRAILPAMTGATLRRMDDQRLVVEVRDAGLSRARMEQLATATMALARALERTRGRLPPPTGMDGAVEQWRALADRLGAELETARMRVEAQLGQMSAEVRLAFDGEGAPMHTWLSVAPPSPIDEEHRLRWRAGDGASVEALSGDAREIARVLIGGADELSIEPERVTVRLGQVLGRDRLDAPQVEQRLSRMAQLVSLLRGQAGPYR